MANLNFSGFIREDTHVKIPEGFNMNNIRQSLVKERVPLPPNKTPEVFNFIRSATPQPEKM